MAGLNRVLVGVLLCGLAWATASCGPPGNQMQNRVDALQQPLKKVVQDAVYSNSGRGPSRSIRRPTSGAITARPST